MSEEDALKIVRLGRLATFKHDCDEVYQSQDVNVSGINATTVIGALAELLRNQTREEVLFEKLSSANDSGLASYRFTKGSGADAVTMYIDIPKDYVNNILGIVNEDGEGNSGTFLKVNISPIGVDPSYQYVDVSSLIEYITVGAQTEKPVQLTIDHNHQITANIVDKSIVKTLLSDDVQTSLALADSALQGAHYENETLCFDSTLEEYNENLNDLDVDVNQSVHTSQVVRSSRKLIQ